MKILDFLTWAGTEKGSRSLLSRLPPTPGKVVSIIEYPETLLFQLSCDGASVSLIFWGERKGSVKVKSGPCLLSLS